MKYEYVLWFGVLAYGLHIIEEALFNWRQWARNFLKINAEWNEFYLFNAFVVLYGCISAIIGWKCPYFALSYPAFMLINAIFFHIIPVIASKRFSPGSITGIVIFLPVSFAIYHAAWIDNTISAGNVLLSLIIAALIMLYPIALQKLKNKRFFSISDI